MTQNIAIFGATSAIATDVARLYAARGARLFLVGRSREKLALLVEELEASVIGFRVQDFDHTEQAVACVEEVLKGLEGSLDIVLVAHGLLGDQLESERSWVEAEQIARTNYLSVMALLIPLANHLERQAFGRLAVLSSVAAERGRPRNYSYAAAKAALNVYLQGLRSRLYARGIKVHIIKLGPVDTPMTTTHRKNLLFARSPDVAKEILEVLRSNQSEAFVPARWRYIMLAVRNLPEGLFQRIGSLSDR